LKYHSLKPEWIKLTQLLMKSSIFLYKKVMYKSLEIQINLLILLSE